MGRKPGKKLGVLLRIRWAENDLTEVKTAAMVKKISVSKYIRDAAMDRCKSQESADGLKMVKSATCRQCGKSWDIKRDEQKLCPYCKTPHWKTMGVRERRSKFRKLWKHTSGFALEVSRLLGVPSEVLYKSVRGEYDPTEAELTEWANKLNLNIDSL